MLLYHLSYDSEPGTKHFIPRVPAHRISDSEDDCIPRICFSTSPLGCINAIPKAPYEEAFAVDATLYTLDTDDHPGLRFLDFWELQKRNLVIDCYATQEYWVLDELTLEGKKVRIEFTDEHNFGVFCALESARPSVYAKLNRAKPGLAKKLDLDSLPLFYLLNQFAEDCYEADLITEIQRRRCEDAISSAAEHDKRFMFNSIFPGVTVDGKQYEVGDLTPYWHGTIN